MMPPPPPCAFPPPEPELPPVSPDLDPMDLESAIWVYGGYPQVEWHKAAMELYKACKRSPFEMISAASIDWLARNGEDRPKSFDELPISIQSRFKHNSIKGAT